MNQYAGNQVNNEEAAQMERTEERKPMLILGGTGKGVAWLSGS